MKIRPLGANRSMPTDRRTDMTKLIVAFHNFANASKDATMRLSVLASWKNKNCNVYWSPTVLFPYKERYETV
jgi:hypothetical protein